MDTKLGAKGVTLFFVISGFLITTLLLRGKESTGTISLCRFYIRRSLRIFPLYHSVILVYIILTIVVEQNSTYGIDFFDNLKYFITNSSNCFVNLSKDRVIFYFAWSLETEEQFYLLWPSVERFFSGWRAVYFALVLIILSQLGNLGFLAPFLSTPLMAKVASSISTAICLGVILAHMLHYGRTFGILGDLLANYWSSAGALLCCIILMWEAKSVPLPTFFLPLSFTILAGSCVIMEDNAYSNSVP